MSQQFNIEIPNSTLQSEKHQELDYKFIVVGDVVCISNCNWYSQSDHTNVNCVLQDIKNSICAEMGRDTKGYYLGNLFNFESCKIIYQSRDGLYDGIKHDNGILKCFYRIRATDCWEAMQKAMQ